MRYHMSALMLGRSINSSAAALWVNTLLDAFLLNLIHVPAIGFMYYKNGQPPPLAYSLYMEFASINRHDGANGQVYVVMAVFPVFVATYTRIQDIAWFLAVCDSMRHLGTQLFNLGWAGLLNCSDPTQCWRSQYLYSHKIFDDMGGASGRWNQIIWYLFCKGQKRQCCCPYRKLKADAPEKCCNPCCAGPYVEESGGCPCPCCCASCAGS